MRRVSIIAAGALCAFVLAIAGKARAEGQPAPAKTTAAAPANDQGFIGRMWGDIRSHFEKTPAAVPAPKAAAPEHKAAPVKTAKAEEHASAKHRHGVRHHAHRKGHLAKKTESTH